MSNQASTTAKHGRIDIHTLYFGEVSAEKEVVKDPDRFMRTYLDVWRIRERLLDNDFFLVLGPKGSGKTAVGRYSLLLLESTFGPENVLSVSKNMDELAPNVSPLTSLTSKLVSEDAQGTTASAWRLYISLQLAALARADHASPLNEVPEFACLWDELHDAGLVSDHVVTADFPTVLRRVREGKLSFSVKFLGGEVAKSGTDEVPVSQLGATILDAVIGSGSPTQYLLVIDGLDRVIGNNKAYWLSVSSLLMAAADVHMKITASGANIRLMVMCRTDVFRKIDFADADKIAGDSSLFVDWANHQTRIEDNYLWDYLAKKAGVSPARLLAALPEVVKVGEKGAGSGRLIDGISYFFSSTRCTPREITMLMRQVREATPPGQAITGERLRNAVNNFASQDLLSIVMAESSGMLEPEVREALTTVISSLPHAGRVRLEDLEAAAVTAGLSAETAVKIAEFLFLAGMLGNLNVQSGYVQFYYRRDTYAFSRRGPWVLHRALMYAFNVPY